MNHVCFLKEEIGIIKLISDGSSLIGCDFYDGINEDEVEELDEVLIKVSNALKSYFKKETQSFDVEIKENGTLFQKIVWNKILEIPYGETRTYKEIGEEVKKELGMKNISYRAIGKAVGSNKILIFIPCHRVVYQDKNKKQMYKAGENIKKYLLKLENSNK